MDIHIKWNNDEEGIILPVNPESFALSETANNTAVVVHNLGEINLKGKRLLNSISFQSFFPAQEYGFERTEFHDPYSYYVTKLNALFEANTTLHLVITDTLINGFFTIEAFEYGHSDKTNDVSYILTLKEYREIGSMDAPPSSTPVRVEKETKTTSVKWKKGDTWQKITKRVLGSSATWKKQKKANADVIKKAKKKYPKKKEKDALVGYKVVIKK